MGHKSSSLTSQTLFLSYYKKKKIAKENKIIKFNTFYIWNWQPSPNIQYAIPVAASGKGKKNW